MIVIYKAFLNDINSGSIKKLYLLYGSETYLLDKGLEEIKEEVVEGFEEINFLLFEDKYLDVVQLRNACDTLPFGSDKKLIVVKDFHGLKSKSKKSKEENEEDSNGDFEVDRLQDLGFIDSLNDEICLLFVSYGNIDKRKKLYKNINKNGSIYEFRKINKATLKQWINRFFKREKKIINNEGVEYLIQSTGYLDKNNDINMYHVENEVEKILSYIGKKETVSMSDIKEIIKEPLENNVFKMIDACLENDSPTALKVYGDLLLDGHSPFAVIGTISWGIKSIIKIKELKNEGLSVSTISRELKMKEFVVRKNINYCNNVDYDSLCKALEKCVNCEADMKTGKYADKRLERIGVEILLAELFE